VIDGGFSLGMMFAYMTYKTQFLQRASSSIDQLIAFRMLGLHLERLSDIALAEQDHGVGERPSTDVPLVGKIELRNVSYRYSPTDPLVLDGVNLCVQPGEQVAITGPSGGGKSTLVKVLLSLIEPDDGELLIDDKPVAKFGVKSYREQVAAVLQDDHIFAGSLADNIALFDDAPDLERVIASAEAAAVHDDILAMAMGYDTLVGDMGSSLSGGQKQRLLIARALYRHPKVLIMDEATSHLDTAREQLVNAAVAKLGITRIIIAHRLETILTASRILSFEHGDLVDVTPRFTEIKSRLGTSDQAAREHLQ
jgi:ATP-binding cassette subfamily B protein RaxB